MNEQKKTQFVGTGKTNNRTLEKQNTRLLMQVFHGCRQKCRECREEEAEWEKEANRG